MCHGWISWIVDFQDFSRISTRIQSFFHYHPRSASPPAAHHTSTSCMSCCPTSCTITHHRFTDSTPRAPSACTDPGGVVHGQWQWQRGETRLGVWNLNMKCMLKRCWRRSMNCASRLGRMDWFGCTHTELNVSRCTTPLSAER